MESRSFVSRYPKYGALVITMLLGVLLTLGSIMLKGCHPTVEHFDISGQVLNGNSHAGISFAHVIVLGDENDRPVSTFADGSGNFSVSINARKRPQMAFEIVSSAYRYSSVHTTFDVKDPRTFLNVELTALPDPLPPTPKQPFEKTEQLQVSGVYGANWSDIRTLCSSPAPAGYRVQNATFKLMGDRDCNGWSECQATEANDNRWCWAFRFQGHNERPGPSSAMAFLTTTYVPIPTENTVPEPAGLAFIQFSPSQQHAAQAMQQLLISNNIVCPTPVEVGRPFEGKIVYYDEAGKKLAVMAETAWLSAPTTKGDLSIPVLFADPGTQASFPPKAIEIWIGAGDRGNK